MFDGRSIFDWVEMSMNHSERERNEEKKRSEKMIKTWVDTFRPKAKKNNNNINDANDYPRKYAFKNKFEFVEWKKNANRDTSAQNKRKTITPPTTTTMITTHLNIVRYARRQCDNGWRLTSVKCEIDNRKVLTLKTSKFRCFFPSFSLSLSRKIYFVTTNLSFSTYCCHSDLWHSTD